MWYCRTALYIHVVDRYNKRPCRRELVRRQGCLQLVHRRRMSSTRYCRVADLQSCCRAHMVLQLECRRLGSTRSCRVVDVHSSHRAHRAVIMSSRGWQGVVLSPKRHGVVSELFDALTSGTKSLSDHASTLHETKCRNQAAWPVNALKPSRNFGLWRRRTSRARVVSRVMSSCLQPLTG